MNFRFKIQEYQTNAVNSVVNVFKGQLNSGYIKYKINESSLLNSYDDGYKNLNITLDDKTLISNINEIQKHNCIPVSSVLSKIDGFGACVLDVEMETGTGKTYVYIKTIFELNKLYGWSKFIIVVPSIAIREGVSESFAMLESHFMEHYKKKANYFIYNSKNLSLIGDFSTSSDISVMIINTQAFAKDLKVNRKIKNSLKIHTESDSFQSRKPIDVISSNRPIIIMDEPQKMSGSATLEGIKSFKPLFVINYSATHKIKHNNVYSLDPLDAYEQKLVKKIKVKGFELKNLNASNGYLCLDEIILSPKETPKARIEIEVNTKSGIKRKHIVCRKFDDLYESSSNLNQYKNYVISDIDENKVYFSNGISLAKGLVIGDNTELTMQRLQIRETIKSHFEKEQELFEKKIKTLSLFFIDKVSNYKQYSKTDVEIKGIFQEIFEEEYTNYHTQDLKRL